MKFTLYRDLTVVDLGHAIEFKKGVPTHVPDDMHALMLQYGAEPEGEVAEPAVVAPPAAGDDREQMILMAIDTIVTRNSSADLTQQGAPHIRALGAELGWKVTNQERDALWVKFQADKAE